MLRATNSSVRGHPAAQPTSHWHVSPLVITNARTPCEARRCWHSHASRPCDKGAELHARTNDPSLYLTHAHCEPPRHSGTRQFIPFTVCCSCSRVIVLCRGRSCFGRGLITATSAYLVRFAWSCLAGEILWAVSSATFGLSLSVVSITAACLPPSSVLPPPGFLPPLPVANATTSRAYIASLCPEVIPTQSRPRPR